MFPLAVELLGQHFCTARVRAKSLQQRPTLCSPLDCRPPGSSIHGLLQTRILEWVAVSFSRGPSGPGVEPASPCSPDIAGAVFPAEPPGGPQHLSFAGLTRLLPEEPGPFPQKLLLLHTLSSMRLRSVYLASLVSPEQSLTVVLFTCNCR